MSLIQEVKRVVQQKAVLYRFQYNNELLLYTDYARPITFESEIYQPSLISHGEIIRSQAEPLKNNVDIETTIRNELVQLWQTRATNVAVSFMIIEIDLKDHSKRNYAAVGTINGVSGTNEKVTFKGVDIREQLQAEIQTALYNRLCPLPQYGARCKLNYEDWATPLTVTAINSTRNIITVAALPIDYTRFLNGQFKNALSEVSAIVNIDFEAMTIELDEQISFSTNVGDTVKVAPSCSYTAKNCKDVFNNIKNFMGHIAISTNVTEAGQFK